MNVYAKPPAGEIVVTLLHVDVSEPEKAPVVTLVRSRPDLSA
jgi:hypothetical protein